MRAQKRSPWGAASSFLAVVVAAFGAYGLLFSGDAGRTVAVSSQLWVLVVMAALGALVLVDTRRRGQFDVFAPPALFAVWVILGYVLPVRSFSLGIDIFSALFPFPYPNRTDAINLALVEVTLGAISFGVGYFAALGLQQVRVRRQPCAWRPGRLRNLGIAYTVAGVTLFAAGTMAMGGVQSLFDSLHDRTRAMAGLNYFFYGINLLAVVALLWWTHTLLQRRRLRPFQIAYTLAALFSVSLLGSKAVPLVVLIAGVAVYHYCVRRVSLAKVLVAFLVATLAFGAYDLFLREYLVIGTITSVRTSGGVLKTVQNVFTNTIDENFLELQNLAVVVNAVPAVIPYQHGVTYLALLSAPVPRGLWAGKFEPSPGIYTAALWPEKINVEGTSMPPGFMGELYMNFGTAGIALGMALFGWLYGAVYRWMLSNPRSQEAVLLYGLCAAMMVHYIRGDSYGPSVLLLILLLPTLVAFRYLRGSVAAPIPARPALVLGSHANRVLRLRD